MAIKAHFYGDLVGLYDDFRIAAGAGPILAMTLVELERIVAEAREEYEARQVRLAELPWHRALCEVAQ